MIVTSEMTVVDRLAKEVAGTSFHAGWSSRAGWIGAADKMP